MASMDYEYGWKLGYEHAKAGKFEEIPEGLEDSSVLWGYQAGQKAFLDDVSNGLVNKV